MELGTRVKESVGQHREGVIIATFTSPQSGLPMYGIVWDNGDYEPTIPELVFCLPTRKDAS